MKTESKYNSTYKLNPERSEIDRKIKTEFSESILEYHRTFVTYVQELREKAKKLNLPLTISPTIDGVKMFDNRGTLIINKTQSCLLLQMIREAKMYEPDYL